MQFRLLQSLFTAAPSQADKFDKSLMLRAIERVVDGVDPRWRAVSHYRHRLWGAVEHALDYVVTFVNTLPPASPVDRRAYLTDPRLRALFVSPDHLQEVLSFSEGVRNYRKRAAQPLPETLYAGLGAARLEKTVLGIELDGEMLQQETPQTVVNFGDHRVVCLADNEPDSRRELMKRGFDYLIEMALQQLASTRLQKQQLEQRQQQLLFQKKVSLLKAARPGLEVLLEPAPEQPIDVEAIERQLQDVEAELAQRRADSATLAQHLARVAAVLGKPETYLRRESVSLTLDHMNIKTSPDSRRVANTLTFEQIILAENRRLIALFIRFPSQELLSQPDAFEEARRFL